MQKFDTIFLSQINLSVLNNTPVSVKQPHYYNHNDVMQNLMIDQHHQLVIHDHSYLLTLHALNYTLVSMIHCLDIYNSMMMSYQKSNEIPCPHVNITHSLYAQPSALSLLTD